MVKIQLTPETRAQDRRRPGFALLKISGWKHSPELSEMSIQRSEDEKYLGADGHWEPIPVWHTLANMIALEGDVIEADVPPAFVDPIIIAPNNSYRVTLQSEGESETRTMRIAGGVLASSAAGSSPESLEQGSGLILGDAVDEPPEPEPEPELEEEIVEETVEEIVEPVYTPTPSIPSNSFFSRHKGKIISALLLLVLLIALGLAWYLKLIPDLDFGNQDNASTSADSAIETPVPAATQNLSDLELLQQFIRSKPDTDQILAQASAWGKTNHCDAKLRLLVHSAHKSEDSTIALEYAKMHDSAYFTQGECIDKPDVDTAQYWYQKAVEAGNSEAKSLLKRLDANAK